jgi:hypothetical protein
MIGGAASDVIPIEVPNAAAMTVIIDDPNAVVGIGAVAGAKLTVGKTLAIEEGFLIDAAHKIAQRKCSDKRENILWQIDYRRPGQQTLISRYISWPTRPRPR